MKKVITDREGMSWLRQRLEKIDAIAFRNTELYRLLKETLGEIGYWKKLPRGNPKKGYAVMRKRNPV